MRESTIKEAFVGSRQDESEIWRLLLQCGAESTADVASRPTPPDATVVDFALDERAPLNDEEYWTTLATFRNVFDDRSPTHIFVREIGACNEPFNYFLERIATSGKRVPSERLYSFAKELDNLGFAPLDLWLAPRFQDASVRIFSLLFGRLGLWASKISPKDELRRFLPTLLPTEVFESSADEQKATRAWREGTDDERVAVLAQLRRRDPARARELLSEDWKNLKKPGVKENCLKELLVGLSESDLEFLEGLEKKTRDPFTLVILRDLLARIPTSKRAQTTFERAEAFLKNPDALNALGTTEEERARFNYESPDGRSLRAAFLALGRVPLARWEEVLAASPKEIRARLLDAQELPTFSAAQLRSFALFGASDEWFEVCCESFADVFREEPYEKRYRTWSLLYLTNPLVHHAVERFLFAALKTGRVDYFQRLRAIWNEKERVFGTRLSFEYRLLQKAIQYAPYPWSEEQARLFCDMLLEQIASPERKIPQDAKAIFAPGGSPSDEELDRRRRLFAYVLAYAPRAVREERRDFLAKGIDAFTPDEGLVKLCLDACAWRERFDRLFGSPENEVRSSI